LQGNPHKKEYWVAVTYPYPIPGFSDPVSSLSHLIGAVVFAVLGYFLLRRACGRFAFLGVYVFSVVFLLAMSGVFHLLPRGGSGRAVLERLDHGAIFVLIAGTFTPAHGILFRGPERWGPLLLIWTAAITGITLKTIFFADLAEWLGLIFYLALGWFGAFTTGVLWWRYGFAFIKPVLWGGLAYTVGGVLDHFGLPILIPGVLGAHDLFHLAVLAGVGFHWKFVTQFAFGAVPIRVNATPAAQAPASV
jgi:channel protein (hemolysin III family)